MNLPVTFTVKLRKDGSIVIPAYLLKEMGAESGVWFEVTLNQKGGK
jgi:bifunctional DNA-binding transcriptional regulator/antitoxin component of YhaV-PrlF toxin-antitoxin module